MRFFGSALLVAWTLLHLYVFGRAWTVPAIRRRVPRAALLGDLVEGHGTAEWDILRGFSRIRAPLGVWAVTGNHERFRNGGGAGQRALEEAGVRVLHDRWIEAAPGLVVAGVDDLTSRRRSGEGGDPIRASLAGRPPGATVLLSHTPWETEAASLAGVGLMLSGHIHGGQIWPFGYLVRLAYPLLAGRYEVDGMTVLVSRGAGTWGPRMRLWLPGEILQVTLRVAG